MFQHQIDAMTNVVAYTLDLGSQAKERVREALAQHWTERIAITWTVRQVQATCHGLNHEQAIAVLQLVLHSHDPAVGVREDTLYGAAETIFGPDPDTTNPEDN